ncbi:hypothetical protein [Metabacillus sp. RGM 3146]|uniref:hypothetical protein n=1 Tax=Metabacillus sp. RGM 3146 TaxID=3401092 RepID=UPI003B9B320D
MNDNQYRQHNIVRKASAVINVIDYRQKYPQIKAYEEKRVLRVWLVSQFKEII